MPSITNLATITALTAVENKIPSVSNLVKKLTITPKIMKLKKKITDHNDDKHITIPEFNKLTAEKFVPRLALANLVAKRDFDDKLKNFNQKKLIQTKQNI